MHVFYLHLFNLHLSGSHLLTHPIATTTTNLSHRANDSFRYGEHFVKIAFARMINARDLHTSYFLRA